MFAVLLYRSFTLVVYRQILNIVDDYMAGFLWITGVIVGSWLSLVCTFCQFSHNVAMKAKGVPMFLVPDVPLKFK